MAPPARASADDTSTTLSQRMSVRDLTRCGDADPTVLDHMRRYQAAERLGLVARARVAFGRLVESEDDELAMAYHCGARAAGPYSREASIRAYQRRALPLYRLEHLRRGLAMALKAIGLEPGAWLGRGLARIAWWLVRHRVRRLARAVV